MSYHFSLSCFCDLLNYIWENAIFFSIRFLKILLLNYIFVANNSQSISSLIHTSASASINNI